MSKSWRNRSLLHLVAGDNQTIAGVTFGFIATSVTQARLLAKPWRPSPQSRSALTIAGVADKPCGFAELTQAPSGGGSCHRPWRNSLYRV